MRRYLELVLAEFRLQSTYRLALAAGIVTNGVFGLIRMGVLLAAIDANGGSVAGYDRAAAISYVWWGQALLGMLPLWWWTEVADRVRTGDIAVDLARPIDLQAYWWCRDLGRGLLQFVARGVPILIIGSLLVPVTWPTSPVVYLTGALGMMLALAVNFLARYGVNLIAVWALDLTGFMMFYGIIVQVFTGFVIPVHIFPEPLRIAAWLTPFPAMYQAPIDILSGRADGAEIARLLAIQAGWLIVLLGLTRLASARAMRRLVIQGG